MHRLKDLIQGRQPVSVEQNQTVAEAVRRMAEANVGAILVFESGKLRGIFSERDIMTRVVAQGVDPARAEVGSVMSTNLATIEESATVEEAMQLMDNHKCRHAPVLRAGEVTGVISMRDLMHFELEQKTEEIRHMQAYIHGT